jgi:hypothetical protein
MKIVRTASGARYRFCDDQVQRMSDNHELRCDNTWINLLTPPRIVVGEPMVLELEPLSPTAVKTVRTTTPVVSIKRNVGF